jgi:hypothetical protein
MGSHRLSPLRQVPPNTCRSDNAVKNHFYALLRKTLRKINSVIQKQFKKEYKQFSPNVLYRIVEVAEEKFKLFPNYDQTLSHLSQRNPQCIQNSKMTSSSFPTTTRW